MTLTKSQKVADEWATKALVGYLKRLHNETDQRAFTLDSITTLLMNQNIEPDTLMRKGIPATYQLFDSLLGIEDMHIDELMTLSDEDQDSEVGKRWRSIRMRVMREV